MDRYSDKYQDHKQAVKADHYCYVCYSILLQHSVIRFLSLQSEEPLSTNQSRGSLSAFEANRRGELIRIINRFTTGEDNHPFMTLRDQLEIVKAVYPFAHGTNLPPGWTETRLILYIYTQIRQQRWDHWLNLSLEVAEQTLHEFAAHDQLLPFSTATLAFLHNLVSTFDKKSIGPTWWDNLSNHIPPPIAQALFNFYQSFIQQVTQSTLSSVDEFVGTDRNFSFIEYYFVLRRST